MSVKVVLHLALNDTRSIRDPGSEEPALAESSQKDGLGGGIRSLSFLVGAEKQMLKFS